MSGIFWFGVAVGVVGGGSVGALIVALAKISHISDLEFQVERLRDRLRDIRSVETLAVTRESNGRFAKRPEVQG